jgi:hypothetical protein
MSCAMSSSLRHACWMWRCRERSAGGEPVSCCVLLSSCCSFSATAMHCSSSWASFRACASASAKARSCSARGVVDEPPAVVAACCGCDPAVLLLLPPSRARALCLLRPMEVKPQQRPSGGDAHAVMAVDGLTCEDNVLLGGQRDGEFSGQRVQVLWGCSCGWGGGHPMQHDHHMSEPEARISSPNFKSPQRPVRPRVVVVVVQWARRARRSRVNPPDRLVDR